ncbi:MAG: iron-sulfur cluster repair di-iron protein [Vicinamibacterales bacterium]
MTSRFAADSLGSIVAADFRMASVLDQFGLDYCCHGKRTLEEACQQHQVSLEAVESALSLVSGPAADMPDASWSADELTRFIVRRHHAYVRAQLPVIDAHLQKLVAVHGGRHPELRPLHEHFRAIADELQMHMMKEEEILFPYIRALAAAAEQGTGAPPNMFGTVMNPIRMMEAEHQSAGNELEAVRTLTGHFTVPADGCTTYRVCFGELEAFDRDLRTHIHLENNLLFPKAVALESTVSGGAGFRGERLRA